MYKHIYYHKTSKTWQAIKTGCTTKCHPKQSTLAKQVARAWHVPFPSLRLQTKGDCKQKAVSSHKHVYWHSSKQVWVAQTWDTGYIGSSATQSGAAKLAAGSLKVRPSALKRKKPKAHGFNSISICKRMSVLFRVYKGQKGGYLLPADLVDLEARSKSQRKPMLGTSDKTHWLLIPALQAKFPAHRDALEAAYQHVIKSDAGNDPEQALHETLVSCLGRISDDDLEYEVVRNVGRKNMHHSSLPMLLAGEVNRKGIEEDNRRHLSIG